MTKEHSYTISCHLTKYCVTHHISLQFWWYLKATDVCFAAAVVCRGLLCHRTHIHAFSPAWMDSWSPSFLNIDGLCAVFSACFLWVCVHAVLQQAYSPYHQVRLYFYVLVQHLLQFMFSCLLTSVLNLLVFKLLIDNNLLVNNQSFFLNQSSQLFPKSLSLQIQDRLLTELFKQEIRHKVMI